MTARPPLPTWQRTLLLGAAAIAVAFVFRRLDASFGAAIDALRSARLIPASLAFVSAAVAMCAIAVGWVPFLRDAGHAAPRRRIVAWYFVGEVTKYVPGGVWALVGRGELAAREIDRRPAYRSVTQSLLVFFASGSLPAAAAIARYVEWSAPLRTIVVLGLLAALPLTIALLRVPIAALPSALGAFAVAWFAIGFATMFAADALDADIGLVDALAISAAAWIAGFVIIFVPGGIGVREATFVALAPASVSPATALAIAVICRFAFVLADTVGAAVGLLDRRHDRSGDTR